MTLAIFDLDNTLLSGDSDYEWGCFLVKKNIVDKEQYEAANLHFFEQYKNGTLDIYPGIGDFTRTMNLPVHSRSRSVAVSFL